METATHIFHVKTMHCDDCATLINNTLRALPGIQNAHATVKTHEIRVELDPRQISPETVSEAITELGFQMKRLPTAQPTDPVEPQISDAAWHMLEPLFRAGKSSRSTRTRDDRQLAEGIAYKYRQNVPWRDVPAMFGPWQTLYARLATWQSDGTWATIAAAARSSAFAGELAWIETAGD